MGEYRSMAHDILRSYNKVLRDRSKDRKQKLVQIGNAIGDRELPELMKATDGALLGDRQPADFDRIKANHGINRIDRSTKIALHLAKKQSSRDAWGDLVDECESVADECWPFFYSVFYATTQSSHTVVPSELRPEKQFYDQQGQAGSGVTINMPNKED